MAVSGLVKYGWQRQRGSLDLVAQRLLIILRQSIEEWEGVQGMDRSMDGSFRERVTGPGEVSRGNTGVFCRRTACL